MLQIVHQQEEAMRKAKIGSIANGDEQRGAYPLGALWAREFIDQSRHDAGVKYAELYGRVFGRTTPGTSDGSPELSEAAMEKCERDYWEAANLLASHSRAIKDAVDNAAVYSRYPSMLFHARKRRSDKHLLDGLEILDKLFNAGERAVA